MIGCVISGILRRLPGLFFGVALAAILGVFVLMIPAIIISIPSGGAAAGPLLLSLLPGLGIFLSVVALVLLVTIIIEAIAECVGRGSEITAGAPGTVSGALQGVTDCASATNALPAQQAAVDAAERALRAQEDRVRETRRRLRRAQAIATGAGAAVAAAAFNPLQWVLIISLIAAQLAALARVVTLSVRLAQEAARLSQLATELMTAQAALAALEALIQSLCGNSSNTTPGINTGTRPVVGVSSAMYRS